MPPAPREDRSSYGPRRPPGETGMGRRPCPRLWSEYRRLSRTGVRPRRKKRQYVRGGSLAQPLHQIEIREGASWVSAYALTDDYATGAAHFVRRRSPLVQDISQKDVPAVAAVYYEMTSPAGPMASYGDEGEGTQGRSQLLRDGRIPPEGAAYKLGGSRTSPLSAPKCGTGSRSGPSEYSCPSVEVSRKTRGESLGLTGLAPMRHRSPLDGGS